jgi:hypothetical protein
VSPERAVQVLDMYRHARAEIWEAMWTLREAGVGTKYASERAGTTQHTAWRMADNHAKGIARVDGSR